MTAHYVYRCYDAQGDLLYVGQSASALDRLLQHRTRAFWAGEVVHVKVTVHPGPEVARAIERRAIWNENPRFNNQGRWRSRANWGRRDYIDYARTLRHASGWYTDSVRSRLEIVFAEYGTKFSEAHPLAELITTALREHDERNHASRLRQHRESDERRQRLQEQDDRDMAAHLAICAPCREQMDEGHSYVGVEIPCRPGISA